MSFAKRLRKKTTIKKQALLQITVKIRTNGELLGLQICVWRSAYARKRFIINKYFANHNGAAKQRSQNDYQKITNSTETKCVWRTGKRFLIEIAWMRFANESRVFSAAAPRKTTPQKHHFYKTDFYIFAFGVGEIAVSRKFVLTRLQKVLVFITLFKDFGFCRVSPARKMTPSTNAKTSISRRLNMKI